MVSGPGEALVCGGGGELSAAFKSAGVEAMNHPMSATKKWDRIFQRSVARLVVKPPLIALPLWTAQCTTGGNEAFTIRI